MGSSGGRRAGSISQRRPVPVPGSEFEVETDMVVFAIGTNANPILGQTAKLKLNKRGYIETDESLATSMTGAYAGGDVITLRDVCGCVLRQC